jgi:hypothetical protein
VKHLLAESSTDWLRDFSRRISNTAAVELTSPLYNHPWCEIFDSITLNVEPISVELLAGTLKAELFGDTSSRTAREA